MNWLLKLIEGSPRRQQSSSRSRESTLRCRPTLEILEERALPSTTSAITSDFNGTPLAGGTSVWFNSVMKVNGLGANPVTIHVTNASIGFAAGGTTYNVAVPDATITFSATTTVASTTFDTASNTWVTNLPSSHLAGNVFMAAVTFQVPPGGLPGGVKPVTWQADFSTDTPGVKVQWQWGAADYKQFSDDYNALGVKPVDDNHASAYHNSDHAGTPENFRNFVTGGARGGGGSNFTGSYSATAAVTPSLFEPPPEVQPASIAGVVYQDLNGDGVFEAGVDAVLAGAVLTLTDSQGQVVAWTTSNDDGSYSFIDVPPGTYTLTESPPPNFSTAAFDNIGTVNGNSDGFDNGNGVISGIILASGNNGISYNFGHVLSGGGGGNA